MTRIRVSASEYELLDLLRVGPVTSAEMEARMGLTGGSARRILTGWIRQALRSDILGKGSALTYSLNSNYHYLYRNIPLLKSTDGRIGNLEHLAGTFSQTTKAHRSARFVPELASNLLRLGYKANSIKAKYRDGYLDEDAMRKQMASPRRELRALKIQLEAHAEAARTLANLYEQLSDDKFWDLNHLANHFAPTTDHNGNLVPSFDFNDILPIAVYFDEFPTAEWQQKEGRPGAL